MPDSPLLTTDHDAIRVITVNRPDKLNALNGATLDALHAAFDAAADDDSVRAVVLTGAGPKAFVAGADIAEMSGLTPVQGRDFSQRGQRMMRRVEKMPKPVIAMVNRSEEHTSELQSLMRISYAVFCLKKKKKTSENTNQKYIIAYNIYNDI